MGGYGPAIGGIVGGLVGSYFGGSWGRAVGASVGMLVGSFIDPPEGPEQSGSPYKHFDIRFNTNQQNIPVPVVYGVNRVGGNYIWAGNVKNVQLTIEPADQGGSGGGKDGKKGGGQSTTVVYADMAVGLSEGPIAGVSELFIGDKRFNDLQGLTWDYYTGTGSQAPDSRLVTALGSLAPRFRNTAYVAMGGNLGQATSLPNINAEISGVQGGLRVNIPPWEVQQMGLSQVAQRGIVLGDASWLCLTHVGGGLYKSVTYGETWYQVASSYVSMEGASVYNAIKEHPGRPGWVWASWTPNNFGDVRMLKSTDYGETWEAGNKVGMGEETTYHEMFECSCILPLDNSDEVCIFSKTWFGYYGANTYKSSGGTDFGFAYSFSEGENIYRDTMPDAADHYSIGARGGVISAVYFPGGDIWVHLTAWMASPLFQSGGILLKSGNQGESYTYMPAYLSTGGCLTGYPLQDSACRLSDKVALFGCRDGTVLRTQTAGKDSWGFSGNAQDLYVEMTPGWHEVQTGLDGMWALAVNSLGIAAATGYKLTEPNSPPLIYPNGGRSPILKAAVSLSLNQGLAWAVIPEVGDCLDEWGLVGQACWFTAERICWGVGHGSDDAIAGGGVFNWTAHATCQHPIFPSSCGNPALIIHDVLTNKRYGVGLDDWRVSRSSILSCSQYCLEQIPTGLVSSTGNPWPLTEQRFCLDYVMDRRQPVVDHLREMLATFRGYLVYSQGIVKLKIERAETTTQSLGMAEIVADSFTWKKQTWRERPNVVRVEFVDPGPTIIDATGKTFQSTLGRFVTASTEEGVVLNPAARYKSYEQSFVEASDTWDIRMTGERRERVLNLTGIKRRTQAYRMAQWYLAKGIYTQHACAFRVGVGALKAEVGDVIAVSHDIPRWAGKLFRIVEVTEEENDELGLMALEYNEALYRDTLAGIAPHGQDTITGNIPVDWTATPAHMARLTAYEREAEGRIEINYTRLVSSDLFGGASVYKRIGTNGVWERLGSQLSLAPTAFLASHLQTITLLQSLEG